MPGWTPGRAETLTACVAVVGLLSLGALPANAQDRRSVTFHVEPGGRPSGSGEKRDPFTSLERAQTAARRAAARGMDVVVRLGGGRYELRHPLTFTPRDSARPGQRVIYTAYPGESPVLSGGRLVRGWRPADDGLWRARVDHVNTRQLFVNGRRAVRARGGSLPGASKSAWGYTTTDRTMERWRNPREIELVYNVKWTQIRGQVARISGSNIRMQQPWWDNAGLFHVAIDVPTYIENAYELLDEPGEWYLDRPAGFLYYRPRKGEDMRDMRDVRAVVPIRRSLVRIRGTPAHPVSRLRFTGLTFAHTTWLGAEDRDGFEAIQANFALTGRNDTFVDPSDAWEKMPAAVSVRGGRKIQLRGNRFTRLGAAGLNVERGTQRSEVVGNKFADVSGSAIQLGDIDDHHPPSESTVVARNRVTDNVIRSVAIEYAGGVGIWGGYVADNTIAHNLLSDLPYTAISIGWGWGARDYPGQPAATRANRVLRNEVDGCVQLLSDGGGVYVLGDQRDLLVAGNVVHGQRGFGGAVYLDEGTRHTTVERNLLYDNGDWTLLTNQAQDNVVRGNWWDFHPHAGSHPPSGATFSKNHLIGRPEEAPASVRRRAGPRDRFRVEGR